MHACPISAQFESLTFQFLGKRRTHELVSPSSEVVFGAWLSQLLDYKPMGCCPSNAMFVLSTSKCNNVARTRSKAHWNTLQTGTNLVNCAPRRTQANNWRSSVRPTHVHQNKPQKMRSKSKDLRGTNTQMPKKTQKTNEMFALEPGKQLDPQKQPKRISESISSSSFEREKVVFFQFGCCVHGKSGKFVCFLPLPSPFHHNNGTEPQGTKNKMVFFSYWFWPFLFCKFQ